VSRAYGEIHESRARPHRFAPWRFLAVTFPRAFRRHGRVFALAVLSRRPAPRLAARRCPGRRAKGALHAVPELHESPLERVQREEHTLADRLRGSKQSFSAYLMTHNTQVAISCLALGSDLGHRHVAPALLTRCDARRRGVLPTRRAGQVKFPPGLAVPHGARRASPPPHRGQPGWSSLSALIGWATAPRRRRAFRRVLPDVGAWSAGRRPAGVGRARRGVPVAGTTEPGAALLLKIRLRPEIEAALLTLFPRAIRLEGGMRTGQLRIRTPEGIVFACR